MANISSKELRENVIKGCEGRAFFLEVDKEGQHVTREICIIERVLSHGSGAGSDCKVEGTLYYDGGKRKAKCPGLNSLRALHPEIVNIHTDLMREEATRRGGFVVPFSELTENNG